MIKRIAIHSLLCLFYISGCSSNGSVDIELPQGVHLEDTHAGSFLKALNIDYKTNLSFIGEIRESLKRYAVLEDVYLEGDSGEVIVKQWLVMGSKKEDPFILHKKMKEASMRFEFPFILYEKMNQDYIWFEYPLSTAGIPFDKLIGEKAKELKVKRNRKNESYVVIRSKADNARLLLFGFRDYCTSMTIVGGA